MATNKIKIWDLPLRAFHWLLVVTVFSAYITAELGGLWIDWHGRLGGFALGLLVFRLIWGFVGSTNARFSSFFPTPSRVTAYIKGQWQGYGHNPLGALSVLALLAILFALIGTGLFANDDIAFNGPLLNLVEKSQSDWLTGLHETIFNILLALIVLHIAAIAFYFFFKKKNLVKPMITGIQEKSGEVTQTNVGGGLVKFIIAVTIASLLVWIIFSGQLVNLLAAKQTISDSTSTPTW